MSRPEPRRSVLIPDYNPLPGERRRRTVRRWLRIGGAVVGVATVVGLAVIL